MQVVKRDGRKVEFDFDKIVKACQKAGFDIKKNAYSFIQEIAEFSAKHNGEIDIEKIQDMVVDRIRLSDQEKAKAYQGYRESRTKARNHKRDLDIKRLVDVEKNDIGNENGNMNSETPSGMISKFGFERGKEYALDHLLSPMTRYGHLNKDFHIHDLDFYPTKSEVCLFQDLGDVLESGIETVNGGVRPAKRLSSALGLVAISLQTSQNCQMGGQAIHSFDYAIAPYVLKTLLLEIDTLAEEWSLSKDEVAFLKNKANEDKTDYEDEELRGYIEFEKSSSLLDRVYKIAVNRTIKECKQGMKGMVHDLNIMSSRSKHNCSVA